MSTQTLIGNTKATPAAPWRIGAVSAAAAAAALTAALAGGWAPHAPRLALLAEASPAVKVHLGAALAGLAFGTAIMVMPKGRTAHRIMGWTWSALMLTAAGSSLFIRGLNGGGFSLIHLLSAWVLLVVPLAIVAARRGAIARHRGAMRGVYIGGLLAAGALAFLPGRLMWQVFIG